ncbi:MAG: succinylglutamate desuccinylase [Candidatus Neomarinimicrobiota bacterium]
MNKNSLISATLIVLVVVLIDIVAAVDFLKMHHPDPIYPSAGLTEIKTLGDYNSNLINSAGDTEIYLFDSGRPGASLLLLGGTHPNEPGSFITAVTIIENVRPVAGRLLVIPRACNSGFTCTDPFEGYPQYYSVESHSGERQFRFGSRVSNPLDQWPDPLVYSHYPSGQRLSGFETRNLNRSYPGRAKGTFTERVGYAIMQLIEQENITLAIDLHEAAPEIPIINAIVYHEKSEEIGLGAVLNLEMLDLSYAPELSPENFRGLSHREWGDRTGVLPFLMETSNPIQGRLRGKTNADLIRYGNSERYREAQQTGVLRIVYDAETGESLERRVGRHLQGIIELLNVFNESNPGNQLLLEDLPGYHELQSDGFARYLK